MFIKKELQKEYRRHLFMYHKPQKKDFNDIDKMQRMAASKKDFYLLEIIHDLGTAEGYQTDLAQGLQKLREEYQTLIKHEIQISHMKNIRDVIELLKGTNTCIVGGAVRDSCLELIPKDFDFVTDITYDDLREMFTTEGYSVNEAGKEFLVIIVSKDGEQYEIANYRKDGTYSDGRRPDKVSIGTIEDDAQRRDFTCNALYYNLKTETLLDPSGQGILDIRDKLLRFIGKPSDRLHEDYLRGWRYLRFLNTKGLKPHPASYRAVKEHWEQIYKFTNAQRVLQEMQKITGF